MISILKPTPAPRPLPAPLLTRYLGAIQHVADYGFQVVDGVGNPDKAAMEALDAGLRAAAPAALPEALGRSKSFVRAWLRQYRDASASYLAGLQGELHTTVESLHELTARMAQADSEEGVQIRHSVEVLRGIAARASGSIQAEVAGAAAQIELASEEMRRQHQLGMEQLRTEILLLRNRIQKLETAAAGDATAGLLTQPEIAERIAERVKDGAEAGFGVLALRVKGLAQAAAHYSPAIAAELAICLIKRLHGVLPQDAELGRWSPSGFVAMLPREADPLALATAAEKRLTGPYVCRFHERTVLPQLQAAARWIQRTSPDSAQLVRRINEYFA